MLERFTSQIREKLTDPERRAQAARVARDVGLAALDGARSEVFKPNGKVRLRGVLRPTHTARKAVQGAIGGARQEVRGQAVEAVRARTTWEEPTPIYPEADVSTTSRWESPDPAAAEDTYTPIRPDY